MCRDRHTVAPNISICNMYTIYVRASPLFCPFVEAANEAARPREGLARPGRPEKVSGNTWWCSIAYLKNPDKHQTQTVDTQITLDDWSILWSTLEHSKVWSLCPTGCMITQSQRIRKCFIRHRIESLDHSNSLSSLSHILWVVDVADCGGIYRKWSLSLTHSLQIMQRTIKMGMQYRYKMHKVYISWIRFTYVNQRRNKTISR